MLSKKNYSQDLITDARQIEHFPDIVFLPEDLSSTTSTSRIDKSLEPPRNITVEFAYPYVGANEVAIVGDFNGWQQQPTQKRSNGFSASVKIPEPGTFRYAFIVDGVWHANKLKPLIQLPDGRECNICSVN